MYLSILSGSVVCKACIHAIDKCAKYYIPLTIIEIQNQWLNLFAILDILIYISTEFNIE